MKTLVFFLILGIIVSLALHERYRIQDDRTPNDGGPLDLLLKKYWHWSKGAFQLQVGVLIALLTNPFGGLFFFFLLTTAHDAYINTTVLDQPIDYLGTTANTDKVLRWIFGKERTVFVIKCILTIGSVVGYLFYK